MGGAVLLAACSTIASYDQVSYEHATNLKVDTLALMDRAVGPYSENKSEIEALIIEIKKAIEYDKGRPLNQATVQLWADLQDRLNSFLADWKTNSSLDSKLIKYREEGASVKTGIAAMFDQIIGLESGKNKPTP